MLDRGIAQPGRRGANFSGNVMGDPDAMELENNLVGSNLTCLANVPVQFGDGNATPNIVGGYAMGECGSV